MTDYSPPISERADIVRPATVVIPRAAELPVLDLDLDHLATRKIVGFEARETNVYRFELRG